jgi:phenylpyruvate tautomerase PptA (4-oxalocrotonate tautomerase family)
MPHIVIKAIKGASPEQVKQAADQIAEIVNKTMGKPKKYISVSYEEYSFDEWKDVYNKDIRGNDNIVIKPDYDPETL